MKEFLLTLPGCETRLVRTGVEYVSSAINQVLSPAISSSEYYIVHNGRAATDSDRVEALHTYHVVFRVLGGKGGFGSMLRSIGAQIEKTTNREACRDLSGRRMRDVNNEKKLRDWVAKADEREKEKEERRKERRERMKAPRYKFNDPDYEQQKVKASEMLDDALLQGLQSSSSTGKGKGKAKKRKTADSSEEDDVDLKKAKELLGVDVNIDSSDSEAATSSSSSSANNRTCSTSTAAVPSHEACSSASSCEADPPQRGDTSERGALVDVDGSLCGEASTIMEACGSAVSSSGDVVNSAPIDQSERDNGVEPLRSAQEIAESVDLNEYDNAEALEALGLEVLKIALMCRGVKCGGTLQDRARRLFSLKGLSSDEIPAALKAKPAGKPK